MIKKLYALKESEIRDFANAVYDWCMIAGETHEYRTLDDYVTAFIANNMPMADTDTDLVTLLQEAKVWKNKDVRNRKIDRAIDMIRTNRLGGGSGNDQPRQL